MILYGVIWEDRHSDSGMEIFSKEEEAVQWCKVTAYKTAKDSDDVEIHDLTNEMKKDNWKFYITYDCEGSGMRVIEITVDNKVMS